MSDGRLETWNGTPLEATFFDVRRCDECGHFMLVMETADETPFAIGHVGGMEEIDALIAKLRKMRNGDG